MHKLQYILLIFYTTSFLTVHSRKLNVTVVEELLNNLDLLNNEIDLLTKQGNKCQEEVNSKLKSGKSNRNVFDELRNKLNQLRNDVDLIKEQDIQQHAALETRKSSSRRIHGGLLSRPRQFPYQVGLIKTQTNEYHGGAVIISPIFVLTAAHNFCLQSDDNNECNGPCISYVDIMGVVGTTRWDKYGQRFLFKRGICHEKFDEKINYLNDIGLLVVDGQINFNAFVQPIRLNRISIPIGSSVIASGWGMTAYPSDIIPKQLQYVVLKTISLDECRKGRKNNEALIKDTQFCTYTSNRGRGVCHGDSGGPTIYGRSLAGIVSYGTACAVGEPDVYTNVSAYINWITNNMERYNMGKI